MNQLNNSPAAAIAPTAVKPPQHPNRQSFEITSVTFSPGIPAGGRLWARLDRIERHEILWVTTGSGLLIVDGRAYVLQPNTCYFLNPGQVRRLQAAGDLDGFLLSLSPEFLHLSNTAHELPFNGGGYQCSGEVLVAEAVPETKQEISEVLGKLYSEFSNHYLLRSEILRGFFRIFMIYLSRTWQTNGIILTRNRDIDLVARFMESVKEHVSSRKMVADYANELSVTPNYLNRLVKKVSGFTASHHIQQYIVREAKRQAIYTGISMKEIAYQLGFDDMAHFSKFFKNNSGMNFSSFKKELHSAA